MSNAIKLTTAEEIRAAVERIGAELEARGGLHSVYCVACGGSLSSAYPPFYLLRQEARSIHAECMTSNEFCHATPAGCGGNSIVLLMSRAGDTPETVTASKKARECGASVITMSILPDAPLKEAADEHFVWAATFKDDYVYSNTAIALRLGFEILRSFEGYAHFGAAEEAFQKLDRINRAAIEKVRPRAEAWANRYQNESVIYTMGSGPVHCVAYSACICHLMEMEWIDSACIHSGDYFHGPFEITDKYVPFLLFKTSGRPRPLDDRAEAFAKEYTDCLEVVDANDYGASEIDEHVREYFDSLILFAVGRVYTETLAVYKQHPFCYRKYMFKEQY
ncbi:MAG: SIS domain-containing protein [Clostridiales bacterium]|nr:SIS domain-containing protein [Clostridiales bacterium]